MHVSTPPRSETTSRPTHPNRRKGLWLALPIAAGAVALTAACSPAAGTSTAGSAASMPASAGTGAAVASTSSGLGTILVDSTGRTIYDFANDKGSTSTCNGACAETWMPVAAPTPLPAAVPGVSAALGSTTRADGSMQLMVAGHPVYTFEGDTAPGQTKGAGIVLNGGLWTAVSPAGSPVNKASSSGSSGY